MNGLFNNTIMFFYVPFLGGDSCKVHFCSLRNVHGSCIIENLHTNEAVLTLLKL